MTVVGPACTVGPDYVRPELDTPDVWHQNLAEDLASGDAALQTWWSVFEDPLPGEGLRVQSLVGVYRALGGGWSPEFAAEITSPTGIDMEKTYSGAGR